MTAAFLLTGGLVVLGLVLSARAWDAWLWRRFLVAYRLRVPSSATVDDIVRWLGTVAASRHTPAWALLPSSPLVLELDASKAGIEYHVLVPRSAQAALLAGIRAALPGARLDEAPEYRRKSLRFTASAEF